jgi:hypothetical protein
MMRWLRVVLCLVALTGCRPGIVPLPKGRDARAVYSAVIDAALFQDSVRREFDFNRGEPPQQIELVGTVAPMMVDSSRADSARAWLQREIPNLPLSLVDGYRPNTDTIPLTEEIVARVPITRVSLRQFREQAMRPRPAWQLLLQRTHPAPARLTLSRVVFSADSLAALIEISGYRGPMDAAGYVVWLECDASGWHVRGQALRWIS